MSSHNPGVGTNRLIVLLGALVAFGPISIDMYLPSLPEIATDLQALSSEVQLTVTLFLTGFCLGMLLYGPLADRFGRKPVLISGIAIYVATSFACTLVDNVDQLIVMRLLQALGGGAASVLARAIVRDVFEQSDAARVLSMMHLITMIAPLLAPVLGGYLLIWFGWRTIFGVLSIFGLICLVIVWLRLEETYPPGHRKVATIGQSFLAYGEVLGNPKALGFVLCGGLSFAGMFAYITGSPFVYIEYFGIAPEYFGYLFAVNIVGIIMATAMNARLVKRVGVPRMLTYGAAVAAVSGIALLISSTFEIGGLIGIALPLFFFVSVTGLLGANCVAELLAIYHDQAGIAAATFGAAQFGLGALASSAVGLFYDGTPMTMAIVITIAGIGSLLGLVQTGAISGRNSAK